MSYLKKLFYESCCEELRILKPGNHSIQSKIIGMDHKKFERAAKISSEILAQKQLSLGESIYESASKCFEELGENYNLGIILLCAPILKIPLSRLKNFKLELKNTLKNISRKEGELIFKAIMKLKPAGIDNYKGKGNVANKNNKLDFREIMKIGAGWDRISRCYVDDYFEILEKGLPYFISLNKKISYHKATTMLYMNYLCLDVDSHISRKFGNEKAKRIMKKSQLIQKSLNLRKKYDFKLLKLDKYLKVFHYNPGTCADLTVTTLLINKIRDIFKFPI